MFIWFFLFCFVYYCVCACACSGEAHTMAHKWKSKDSFVELVLSFHFFAVGMSLS